MQERAAGHIIDLDQRERVVHVGVGVIEGIGLYSEQATIWAEGEIADIGLVDGKGAQQCAMLALAEGNAPEGGIAGEFGAGGSEQAAIGTKLDAIAKASISVGGKAIEQRIARGLPDVDGIAGIVREGPAPDTRGIRMGDRGLVRFAHQQAANGTELQVGRWGCILDGSIHTGIDGENDGQNHDAENHAEQDHFNDSGPAAAAAWFGQLLRWRLGRLDSLRRFACFICTHDVHPYLLHLIHGNSAPGFEWSPHSSLTRLSSNLRASFTPKHRSSFLRHAPDQEWTECHWGQGHPPRLHPGFQTSHRWRW